MAVYTAMRRAHVRDKESSPGRSKLRINFDENLRVRELEVLVIWASG